MIIRSEARPEDVAWVRRAARATGFFSAEEIEVAGEVVEDRLAEGAASGYELLFVDSVQEGEAGGETLAFACYGRIPLTVSSHDLYWIIVAPAHQGQGLGRALLAEVEQRVRAAGGTRIYVDTSSRAQYEPTRAFYRACGYPEASFLADFYAPADGKVIHCKLL